VLTASVAAFDGQIVNHDRLQARLCTASPVAARTWHWSDPG